MEEKEIKTASYFVNKYKLKKQVDDEFFGQITYNREIHKKDENISLSLIVDLLDDSVCKFMAMKFYKNKWDKKWKCYGVFGKPRYIENIKNDLKENTKNEEIERNL